MSQAQKKIVLFNREEIIDNFSGDEQQFMSNLKEDQLLLNKCKEVLLKREKSEQFLQFANSIFEDFQKFASNQLQQECILEAFAFGSFYQGCCFHQSSDADFTIQISYSKNNIVNYHIVQNIIKNYCLYQQNNRRLTITNNEKFRIPLLSIEDKQNKFKIDIINYNILGILNSKLINQYFNIDSKIKMLNILFKQWAQENHFNTAFQLSSYALANMVIYFLIESGYIVSLQDNQFYGKEPKFSTIEQYSYSKPQQQQVDISFLTYDRDQIKRKLYASQKFQEFQNKSLYALFYELILYYQLFDFSNNIISIKPLQKRNPNHLIMNKKINIEDPFDNYYNPGSRLNFNLDQFKKKLTEQSKELLDKLKVIQDDF